MVRKKNINTCSGNNIYQKKKEDKKVQILVQEHDALLRYLKKSFEKDKLKT